MIRVEYFCTRCNASAQRRDPGDEVNTGYEAVTVSSSFEAKRVIAVHPPKWTTNEQGHLICPACVAAIHPTEAAPPAPRPSAPDGWPSQASPFENA